MGETSSSYIPELDSSDDDDVEESNASSSSATFASLFSNQWDVSEKIQHEWNEKGSCMPTLSH